MEKQTVVLNKSYCFVLMLSMCACAYIFMLMKNIYEEERLSSIKFLKISFFHTQAMRYFLTVSRLVHNSFTFSPQGHVVGLYSFAALKLGQEHMDHFVTFVLKLFRTMFESPYFFLSFIHHRSQWKLGTRLICFVVRHTAVSEKYLLYCTVIWV